MDKPILRDGKGENYTDGNRLDYQAGGFKKIQANCLVIAFSYQTSFLSINTTISFQFKLVYPLAANDFTMSRRKNQVPSHVLNQSIIFILNSLLPLSMFDGLVVSR